MATKNNNRLPMTKSAPLLLWLQDKIYEVKNDEGEGTGYWAYHNEMTEEQMAAWAQEDLGFKVTSANIQNLRLAAHGPLLRAAASAKGRASNAQRIADLEERVTQLEDLMEALIGGTDNAVR